MKQEVNQHTYVTIRGLVGEEYRDSFVKEVGEGKIVEVYAELPEHKTLFFGLFQELEVEHEDGLFYLEIKAVSSSYIMDIKKKKRPFQDKALTYKDLVRSIAAEYPSGAILDTASKGSAIGKPFVQYKETDWEFLKRLASQFHKSIYSEVSFSSPKIYFGIRTGTNMGQLESYNFTIRKNIKEFLMKRDNYLPSYSEQDGIRYYVKTDKANYEIGDYCTYQGQKLYVRSKETKFEHDILYFHYELCQQGGLEEPSMENEKIVGNSIEEIRGYI